MMNPNFYILYKMGSLKWLKQYRMKKNYLEKEQKECMINYR